MPSSRPSRNSVPDNQNLVAMLRAPALAHPDSLASQLDFIRRRWGELIGAILRRLLSSLDLIREEERPVFGVGGQGQAQSAGIQRSRVRI